MERSRPVWLALVLILSVQVIVYYQMQGPPPKGAEAGADQFSAERAFSVLQRLLGNQRPHPTGTEENQLVRQRLIAELENLGMEIEIQETSRGPKRQRRLVNVLARLPNTTSLGQPLVLVTHYDSVPAGPGAADAGSCVVALLETARAMQTGGPYRRPVYFLFTDGEEAGLLGAAAFAGVHPLAKEKPFVINFEARGTSGASLMFETHYRNLATVQFMARHLPRPCMTGSSFVTVYRYMPNDTDFTVFQRDGWTGLNFAFIGDAHRYHTEYDSLENLSLRSLQHHGDNALALARAIATRDDIDLEASSQDAVFFDLLGMKVIHVPQAWAFPSAMAFLVILALASVRPLRASQALKGVFLTCLAMILAVAVSAMVGWTIAFALVQAGFLPRPHVAHGVAISLVYLPAAILAVYGSARLCLRGVSRASVWAFFWLVWSLAGVGLAWWLPGFSYVLVAPAAAAALLSLLPIGSNGRLVLSAVAASVILVPMANLMPVVLGPRAGMILCPVFALLLLPLLPEAGQTDSPGDVETTSAHG